MITPGSQDDYVDDVDECGDELWNQLSKKFGAQSGKILFVGTPKGDNWLSSFFAKREAIGWYLNTQQLPIYGCE